MSLKLFDIFVFFYLIMDLLTTYIGIIYGYGEEINTIFIIYGYETFLLFKTLVILIVLILVKLIEPYSYKDPKRTIVTGLLVGLIICSAFIVVNNILLYFDIELIRIIGIIR